MFKTLDSANRRLYFLLLVDLTFFGLIFTIAGAALPKIIRTFGWSYTVAGLVLAASSAGYILSAFLNGFLVQRVHPKVIMTAGLVIGAVSLAFFARWPSPWLNLLLNFGIGLCQGAMELVANLEVIHMEQKGQSRLMNLIHAAFCVGAIVGPAGMGFMLKAGIPFVAMFVAAGMLSAVLAVVSGLTRFPRVPPAVEKGSGAAFRMLRQPLVPLMTAALLIYVGVEIGISSWVSEYSVRVLRVSASTGAFAVALYWFGLLAGRLGISFWYRGTRQELLMLTLSVVSVAALVVVLLLRSLAGVAAAIFVVGVGCSGFYPLAMSVLGKRFKSGVAVGTAATGGAVGSLAFPFLMALLSQTVGIGTGFLTYVGMNVLLVGLTAVLAAAVRRSYPASS